MTSRAKNRIEKEHYYLVAVFFTLITLVLVYMYLLSATVAHVVMQKEIRGELNKVHSDISVLESEYIALQHSVSGEIASLQGFVATGDKLFIDKSDTSLVLSSNGI